MVSILHLALFYYFCSIIFSNFSSFFGFKHECFYNEIGLKCYKIPVATDQFFANQRKSFIKFKILTNFKKLSKFFIFANSL